MKQHVATRAFIMSPAGRVLVIREAPEYEGGYQTGKYDLPGGKIELGEHHIDAVKREANEEAGIEIEVGRAFYVDEWYPEIHGEKHQIVAVFFACTPVTSEVELSGDHDDFQWIDPARYREYHLMEENAGAFAAYNERCI